MTLHNAVRVNHKNLVLLVVLFILTFTFAALAQSNFLVKDYGPLTSNASTTGVASSHTTRIFKALEEGYGDTTLYNQDNSSNTATVTYKFQRKPTEVAIRIGESAPTITSLATDVVYFWWNVGSQTLNMKFLDASATTHIGSFAFTP